MAETTHTHDYFQLSRLSRWHIESDAINRTLAMVIKAQYALPMAQSWSGDQTLAWARVRRQMYAQACNISSIGIANTMRNEPADKVAKP